jgi:PKHD-type hydroxylase
MLTTKSSLNYTNTYPYVYLDNLLSNKELDTLEKYFDSLPLTEAQVAGSSKIKNTDKNIRDSLTSFIYPNEENMWVFNTLLGVADYINCNYYNYDLLGFDYLQYTVYNKLGDNYAYHMDMALGNSIKTSPVPRKLSFSLIFSEKEDFEGGNLEFLIEEGNSSTVEQKRGRIIAFPSYILHQVTPITKGVRKSLVFWACGPKFK